MNSLSTYRAQHRQSGVAIITSILVIALGTIAMVAITSTQQLDMQRERNEGVIQQARSFGVSGERFAAVLLFRDFQNALRDNTDSLDDDWAQTLPPVPIDNASLEGCIVDMQGRFNLNNLINAEGLAVADYVEQFRNLLAALTIDIGKADAVVDWIDADIDPLTPANGAEDDYYTGLEMGYRTSNAPFVSVSELQLVKGFSSAVEEEAEDYELLLPHISALPTTTGPTPVNVNTATPEVLASLSDSVEPFADTLSRWEEPSYEDYPECQDLFDLSVPDATTAAVPEIKEPWETKADFDAEVAELIPQTPAAGATTGGQNQNPNANAQQNPAPAQNPTNATGSANIRVGYDVRSNYFQVRIDVQAEGIVLTQYTLLERDADGKTRVLYRSRDTL